MALILLQLKKRACVSTVTRQQLLSSTCVSYMASNLLQLEKCTCVSTSYKFNNYITVSPCLSLVKCHGFYPVTPQETYLCKYCHKSTITSFHLCKWHILQPVTTQKMYLCKYQGQEFTPYQSLL